jgi:recombination associated protein RdgC
MPIRRGAVSFSRFRVQGSRPKDTRRWVLGALKARCFVPIDPQGEEDRAAGFVELEQDRRTDFSVGDVFLGRQALCGYRVEKLRIPAGQMRAHLLEWAQRYEVQNRRAPGRRERAEEKEAFRRQLRKKQEPSAKVFDVSLDLATGDVFVWASARAVVDEIQEALEAELKVRLVPRVPAAFAAQRVVDALEPTPELFGEGASDGEA